MPKISGNALSDALLLFINVLSNRTLLKTSNIHKGQKVGLPTNYALDHSTFKEMWKIEPIGENVLPMWCIVTLLLG